MKLSQDEIRMALRMTLRLKLRKMFRMTLRMTLKMTHRLRASPFVGGSGSVRKGCRRGCRGGVLRKWWPPMRLLVLGADK